MSHEPLLVKDLGEHGLLEKLQRFCPPGVVGDDGAVINTHPHRSLVVTTDVLVEEVHFSDRTTAAFDIGWRATAANLSDLAAMGATPLGITVGLSLPGEKLVSWVEEVYQGIDACLKTYQTSLVGGDLCRSPVASLAITAFGEVTPERAIRRSCARPGDAIVITGLHGLARGGLELLLAPSKGSSLTPAERSQLIEAHQRPKPRLDVLPYLAKIPQTIAIAGMDSSDGLADAVRQICCGSGVGAVIDLSRLTIFPGLVKLAGDKTAWEWMFYGGEDFELVLCLTHHFASNLVKELGENAVVIGEITANEKIKLVNSQNYSTADILNLNLNLNKGFQHF
ncbi:MAG: thiamine-phosphate kinase [Pleurocapsa sp.]